MIELCQRCNVIHKRRSGEVVVIYRCADPVAVRFTQDVEPKQCLQCSQYQAIVANSSVPKLPSLPRRIWTWVEATTEWIAEGRPERSDEEVARIYSTFCAPMPPCRWFNVERQLCQGCGCKVTADGSAIFNKIRMATQHCPRNLW